MKKIIPFVAIALCCACNETTPVKQQLPPQPTPDTTVRRDTGRHPSVLTDDELMVGKDRKHTFTDSTNVFWDSSMAIYERQCLLDTIGGADDTTYEHYEVATIGRVTYGDSAKGPLLEEFKIRKDYEDWKRTRYFVCYCRNNVSTIGFYMWKDTSGIKLLPQKRWLPYKKVKLEPEDSVNFRTLFQITRHSLSRVVFLFP